MARIKRVLLTALITGLSALGMVRGTGCVIEQQRISNEKFQKEEVLFVEDLAKSSPFFDKRFELKIPEKGKELAVPWYAQYHHLIVNKDSDDANSGDIIFYKEDKLLVAKNRDETSAIALVSDTKGMKGRLFAVNMGDEEHADIYWIDSDKNIHHIINKAGTLEYVGIDGKVPKALETARPRNYVICNVNGDSLPDFVYQDNYKVGGRSRNMLKAAYGSKDDSAVPVNIHYLGKDSIDRLIAGDFDKDSDSDLAFKLSGKATGKDVVVYEIMNRTQNDIFAQRYVAEHKDGIKEEFERRFGKGAKDETMVAAASGQHDDSGDVFWYWYALNNSSNDDFGSSSNYEGGGLFGDNSSYDSFGLDYSIKDLDLGLDENLFEGIDQSDYFSNSNFNEDSMFESFESSGFEGFGSDSGFDDSSFDSFDSDFDGSDGGFGDGGFDSGSSDGGGFDSGGDGGGGDY